MSDIRYIPLPKNKDAHFAQKLTARNEWMLHGGRLGSHIVLFEAASTAREIIRVYVETIDQARHERVITF